MRADKMKVVVNLPASCAAASTRLRLPPPLFPAIYSQDVADYVGMIKGTFTSNILMKADF